MRSTFFRILIPALMLLPIRSFAEGAAATKPTVYNPLLIALVSLAVIFVFAIGMLSIVLKQLAFAYHDKQRKEKAGKAIKTTLLLLAFLAPAMQVMAQDAAPGEVAATVSSPYISGIPVTDFYFIIGLLAFEALIMLVLLFHISALVKVLRGIPEKAHVPAQVLGKKLLKLLNKSVAVEEESSILLDHDYDGIQELDNDLPPWWKYGFVLTVIVAFIYVGYYHAAGGPSQVEEYHAAVAKGEEEKAAYLAKSANNVDENTVTVITDAGELAGAENIFQTACAACHAKDGGGTVGPNLTDDYWLHGGSIKDIFKTVKYGWPDKGMKSWKDDYSPKQIAAITSYVKSLKGKPTLAPKAAQGDLFVEGTDTKTTDSTATTPAPETTGKTNSKTSNYTAKVQ
jgi:cytochrome c oxidase cbb3-type subunit 3